MTKDLLPGENLIMRVHQHWIFIAKSLALPVVLILIVAVADVLLPKSVATEVRVIALLAVLALAILWLIVVWIRWQATSYTLTDQRIKIQTGVFSRAEKIIPIDRVQDCTTRISLIGRMLGYGRVEIDAAGPQGAEILAHLPSPGSFRDAVFVQSERRRGAPAAQQPTQTGV